jgi:hypothetical protein
MPYFPPAGGGVVLPNSIDDTLLADMPDGTVKGRALGAGVGDPTSLTPAQLNTLLNVAKGLQVFGITGTYTRSPGCSKALVIVVGGGGGGGGVNATSAGTGGAGGGGAGGGCSIKFVSPGVTEAVTVGIGGTAGAPGTAGGTGATSSFGAHCSASGGGGGNGHGPSGGAIGAYGGIGGVGASGSLNFNGSDGGYAIGTAVAPASAISGFGGGSFFGGSAFARSLVDNSVGVTGRNYGGGGSGGSSYNGSAAQSGGAGAPGVVFVFEFA